jgi:hypothetical protein
MDRDLLATLVGSASTPASADQGPLTRLARSCWPHAADSTVPAALHWVRRWGPHPHVAPLPGCACATGRCGTCN